MRNILKNITISDHTPAILKDHRLSFNLGSGHHAEPAMANIIESPGSELHGVAFCVTKERYTYLQFTYDYKNNMII